MLNKCVFVFTMMMFSSTALYASDDILQKAELALDYIHSDLKNYSELNDDDRVSTEEALGRLDNALTVYDFSLPTLLKIHRAYINAIHKLNMSRKEVGEAIDINGLETEITRVEDILKNNPDSREAADLFYMAGQVALYLLEDERLAHQYWKICANSGHAGCMNILASNYYSGIGGTSQDLQKSFDWHKKTYETGLRYACAGVLSASEISTMLFLFPSLSNNEDWRDWANRSQDLLAEFEQQDRARNGLLCRKGELMLLRYVFNLAEGVDNQALLQEAKLNLDTEFDEADYIDAYRIIGESDFADKSLLLLENVSVEYYKCEIALTHLLYARALNQNKLAEDIMARLSSADAMSCDILRATRGLLQTKGTW